MELSSPLQADILHIQEQIKSAIHKHQLLLATLKVDAENAEIKKQLGELQRYIMCLGANQKRLLQELRNKLDDSSNSSHKKSDSEASLDSPATPTLTTATISTPTPQITAVQTAEVSDSEQTPSKRARVESPSPPVSPCPSEDIQPPATPPLSIKCPSPSASPLQDEEDKKEFTKTSPSTRSTRSHSPTASLSPRMLCTPPIQQEDEIDKAGGDLAAAIKQENSSERQQYIFLACLELITHELSSEIKVRRELCKHKPSAMNPFIKYPPRAADPSQNHRRETYLQSTHSPRKDCDVESIVSASASDIEDVKTEEEAGENDQLFIEHRLDQLQSHIHSEFKLLEDPEEPLEKHPFMLWNGKEEKVEIIGLKEEEEDEDDKEIKNFSLLDRASLLFAKRNHLIEIHQTKCCEKEALELRKESLAEAIQEQARKMQELLDHEQKMLRSIAAFRKFLDFIQTSPTPSTF